ncbi:MAG: Na+/H+ antiporter NhaA [Sinimarinibacterium sp.]|jgi:NhaA family Na+:H+ antiporter
MAAQAAGKIPSHLTIFFLVVGLEIRRELHEGTLASVRAAALPAAAAIGGIVAPALIFVAFNRDEALRTGWAIPTATDIAFAVGILALLGKRVPMSLRIFLLALAIIDDIVAIVVIALFYSKGVAPLGLFVAGLGIGLVFVFQRLGLRTVWPYVVPGAVIWFGMLHAGVGFTMSIFIANLAFPGGERLAQATLAVLAGSAVAGILGLVFGRLVLRVDCAASPAFDGVVR